MRSVHARPSHRHMHNRLVTVFLSHALVLLLGGLATGSAGTSVTWQSTFTFDDLASQPGGFPSLPQRDWLAIECARVTAGAATRVGLNLVVIESINQAIYTNRNVDVVDIVVTASSRVFSTEDAERLQRAINDSFPMQPPGPWRPLVPYVTVTDPATLLPPTSTPTHVPTEFPTMTPSISPTSVPVASTVPPPHPAVREWVGQFVLTQLFQAIDAPPVQVQDELALDTSGILALAIDQGAHLARIVLVDHRIVGNSFVVEVYLEAQLASDAAARLEDEVRSNLPFRPRGIWGDVNPSFSFMLPPTAGPTVAPTLIPTELYNGDDSGSGDSGSGYPAETTLAPMSQPTSAPTTLPTQSRTPENDDESTSGDTGSGTEPISTSTPTALPTQTPTRAPSVRSTTLAPTTTPTTQPSPAPTKEPTPDPSASPTTYPTVRPSAIPTAALTGSPRARPTVFPNTVPTAPPTAIPTKLPTLRPTSSPTAQPTGRLSDLGTESPTTAPTEELSGDDSGSGYSGSGEIDDSGSGHIEEPTVSPTSQPTSSPTRIPTLTPHTQAPTLSPTSAPLAAPTLNPSTGQPTTSSPTPSVAPTTIPTSLCHPNPCENGGTCQISPEELAGVACQCTLEFIGDFCTIAVSSAPTKHPTRQPSHRPTRSPTVIPTETPSSSPSEEPSVAPTFVPTRVPSFQSTGVPTSSPTELPSSVPTTVPSTSPSTSPTASPSRSPSASQSRSPSASPSTSPSASPSTSPSTSPTEAPTTTTTTVTTVATVVTTTPLLRAGSDVASQNEDNDTRLGGFLDLWILLVILLCIIIFMCCCVICLLWARRPTKTTVLYSSNSKHTANLAWQETSHADIPERLTSTSPQQLARHGAWDTSFDQGLVADELKEYIGVAPSSPERPMSTVILHQIRDHPLGISTAATSNGDSDGQEVILGNGTGLPVIDDTLMLDMYNFEESSQL